MPQPDAIVPSGEGPVLTAGSFKNQWLNFALYLPNLIFMRKRNPDNSLFCRWLLPGAERLSANTEPLGGGEVSTEMLANGNEYQTAFVEIDKTDFLNMLRTFPQKNGYSSDALPPLLGVYQTDPNARNQGGTLDAPGRQYFYRGLAKSDILQMLVEWNVLS
jgi:hypothetical protein